MTAFSSPRAKQSLNTVIPPPPPTAARPQSPDSEADVRRAPNDKRDSGASLASTFPRVPDEKKRFGAFHPVGVARGTSARSINWIILIEMK